MQAEPETRATARDGTTPGIRRALNHIERHFTESLYLENLASLAGLSVCRFVTVFRRQVGLTPHRFICHRRVAHAKALLRDGMAPALVASEAGFFDQSHLSRHFKAVCGTTPGRYLRELGHRRPAETAAPRGPRPQRLAFDNALPN